MAITANKKFWTEFIDMYHSLPSLWNTKDENYNNRESRSMAWRTLVHKLRDVEPDANQDSVKRKINTFRSNFNREVRKIRHTQRIQPGEVYHPTLWYFDHLAFLLNQEKYHSNNVSVDGHYDEEMTLMGLTTAKSEIMDEHETIITDSVNHDEMALEENQKDQNSQYEKLIPNKSMNRIGVKRLSSDKLAIPEEKLLIDYTPAIENVPAESSTFNQESVLKPETPGLQVNYSDIETQESPTENLRTPKLNILRSNIHKKTKLRSKLQNSHNKTFKNNIISSILTDEAAIYGQSWACGFRKLSPQQKLFAKKAIDEILVLGQLDALKLQTVPMNVNLLDPGSGGE